MKNPFEDKTDEELKVLYEQYKDFQKTGMIPDNELGKIRDELYEKNKCRMACYNDAVSIGSYCRKMDKRNIDFICKEVGDFIW